MISLKVFVNRLVGIQGLAYFFAESFVQTKLFAKKKTFVVTSKLCSCLLLYFFFTFVNHGILVGKNINSRLLPNHSHTIAWLLAGLSL